MSDSTLIIGFLLCTKMKFFIKDFASKYEQIRNFLLIYSHLSKKIQDILKGKFHFLRGISPV